jgi:hypothetical protein
MPAPKRRLTPAQKPPRARQWSAGYVSRVKALRTIWADHVFDYARRQFGRTDAATRADAKPPKPLGGMTDDEIRRLAAGDLRKSSAEVRSRIIQARLEANRRGVVGLPVASAKLPRAPVPVNVGPEADELRAISASLFESLGLPRYLTRAARKIAGEQARYVQRVARIPISNVAPTETLRAWRQKNLDLIKSLNESDIDRAGQIVHEIHARGGRWEDAAKELTETLKVSDRRAKLIARDQIGKLNSDLQQHSQQSAGITRYRWSTSRDYAVRGRPGGEYEKSKENHWELEGTEHDWSNPPKIPGIAERAHPGQRYNCRCVAVPIVPWLDALK